MYIIIRSPITFACCILFVTQDIGTDTPDKNMITLLLSYLYQTVEDCACCTEVSRKEASLSEVTRRVSGFIKQLYTITDRYILKLLELSTVTRLQLKFHEN